MFENKVYFSQSMKEYKIRSYSGVLTNLMNAHQLVSGVLDRLTPISIAGT
jgi:hypothetical protein